MYEEQPNSDPDIYGADGLEEPLLESEETSIEGPDSISEAATSISALGRLLSHFRKEGESKRKKFDELENKNARRIYSAAHTGVNGVGKVLLRYRVEGAEHIPKDGPVLIVLNHLSGTDIFAAPAAVKRHTTLIGRRGIIRGKKGRFFTYMGARTMKRVKKSERSKESIEGALNVMREPVREGRVEMLFASPNTRTAGYSPSEPNPGFARIAFEEQVPTVAGIVKGTDRIFKNRGPFRFRPHVDVRFSEPFPPPQNRRERNELVDKVGAWQQEAFASIPDPDGYYKAPHPGQFDIEEDDD